MTTMGRSWAEALDADNPLRGRRDLFVLPEGLVYLDGNSLGAMPRAVPDHLDAVVREQWATGLISSWNDARWMTLPPRVGAKIAPLIGVSGTDVHVGDSTTVLLYKTMVAACRLRPERRGIVVGATTFPPHGDVAAGGGGTVGGGLRGGGPADPAAAVGDGGALLALAPVGFPP